MKNNFTMSLIWKESIFLRYDLSKLISTGNLMFFKDGDTVISQHFFNFNFSEEDINNINRMLDDGFKIKFSYVDKTLYKKILKIFGKKNVYILDKWDAPILKSDNIDDYLRNTLHSQVKKNYANYLKSRKKYKFVMNNKKNGIKLWCDVLKVDYNSWKGKNKCDMKSLNREDLQYIFHLLYNEKESSLLVCYSDDEPLAYSLMFKNNQNNMWYAVKWGASFDGRKKYLGIYSLFEHLLYLQKCNGKIDVDFWGRRSQVYDSLKNYDVERYHIMIKKDD